MDGLMVPSVAEETLIEMLLCRGEITTAHGDARQLEVGGVLPGGVPGRFAERVIRRVPSRLHDQRQPQVVIRLAVVRIGVVACQAGDRDVEEGFRIREATASEQQSAQRVVAASVARIAAQAFAVVVLGGPRRMAVLLEMYPGQIQRFDGIELIGRVDRPGGSGRGLICAGFRTPADQHLPRRMWITTSSSRVSSDASTTQGDSNEVAGEPSKVASQRTLSPRTITGRQLGWGRRVGSQYSAPFVQLERDGRIERGVLDHADSFVRHEVLRETLLFTRHQPREVGLIVGEHTAHQFDVGTVVVGQFAIPRAPKSPCPQVHCFLPGDTRCEAMCSRPACRP